MNRRTSSCLAALAASAALWAQTGLAANSDRSHDMTTANISTQGITAAKAPAG
jgi:hypothetical protein